MPIFLLVSYGGIHARPKCRSAENLILFDFSSLPERGVTPHLLRKSNKPNKQEFVNGAGLICGTLANRFSNPLKFPGKAGEVVGSVVQALNQSARQRRVQAAAAAIAGHYSSVVMTAARGCSGAVIGIVAIRSGDHTRRALPA
jgi:hypothetical protein